MGMVHIETLDGGGRPRVAYGVDELDMVVVSDVTITGLVRVPKRNGQCKCNVNARPRLNLRSPMLRFYVG
jgi:hypothetical protein